MQVFERFCTYIEVLDIGFLSDFGPIYRGSSCRFLSDFGPTYPPPPLNLRIKEVFSESEHGVLSSTRKSPDVPRINEFFSESEHGVLSGISATFGQRRVFPSMKNL
jgi:hypothetical protein